MSLIFVGAVRAFAIGKTSSPDEQGRLRVDVFPGVGDWLFYGVRPDYTVDWSSSLIVRLLRAAESRCAWEDGLS
jgi:hypothetical protein